MNELQYNKFKATYGEGFVKGFEKWIDPTELVHFDQVARLKGDQQSNIHRFAGQFLQGHEQQIPITVVPHGVSGDQWTVKDGVTRGRAKQEAYCSDPSQKVLITTLQYSHLDFTEEQWEDFQDNSNDHLGCTPSSSNDIENAIDRRIKSARLNSIVEEENNGKALDSKNSQEFAKYCKLAGQWFARELWPNSGKDSEYFSKKVQKLLATNKSVPDSIQTHNSSKIQKDYAVLGGTHFIPTQKARFVGINQNGEKVVAARGNNQVPSNIYGALLWHETQEHKNDFTIILSYDKVYTKEGEDIVQDRVSFVDLIERAVSKLNPGFAVRVKTTQQIQSDPAGFATIYDSTAPCPKNKTAPNLRGKNQRGGGRAMELTFDEIEKLVGPIKWHDKPTQIEGTTK